ncbi:MAG: Spy/CpxP family protein refolding chaperone [Rhizobiales bacterium]|nr:Spy/CpxP family protein refolding chaperone [Hyphomicrobiales bacterium]
MAAGMVSATAGERTHGTSETSSGFSSAIEARLAQAKAALQLRPDQERHWPRIAAAVRNWASQARQRLDEDSVYENSGYMERARAGAARVASKAVGAQRVLSAAMPLFRTLDADQKQTANALAQSLGLGHLASAL